MFGDDSDLFGFAPDMDLDGDHDLVDALIFEDILREEHQNNTSTTLFDDDWRIDCEDGSAFNLDPDDFDTLDEYEEALEEARLSVDWRITCEDGSAYDLDPEDFDTLEEYEEALREAESFIIVADIDTPIKRNFDKSSSSSTSTDFIRDRKNSAKAELREAKKDNYWGEKEDIERCSFIATSNTIASSYLTTNGIYLYSQAIKDHFDLPFSIPDEIDCVQTHFETLLQDLAEDNPKNAIKIWEWVLVNFQPFLRYCTYANEITHGILLDLGNFPDDFVIEICNHMIGNSSFIDKLILNCSDTLWSVETFVCFALSHGDTDTAKRIINAMFNNPHNDVHDQKRIIENCIDECKNYDELETMELFSTHIVPIIQSQSDVRLHNKLKDWQKTISEYIASMEESEQYAFSRKYAWRDRYRTENRYEYELMNSSTEAEFLSKVEEKKYSWRRYIAPSKLRLANPEDFETADEFHAAVRKAFEAEEAKRKTNFLNNPNNTTLYSFCKVASDFPNRPFLYYLTGNLKLKIGDRVLVPLGNNNKETEGIVVAVGECFGASFPCPVSKLKTVLCIVQDDAK